MARNGLVGIDVGGTLIKIAYRDGGRLVFRKFGAAQSADAAAWVNRTFGAADICLTGGGAHALERLLGRPCPKVVEFEATCRGIVHLLDSRQIRPDAFILTNVGTGTSIHFVQGDRHIRVGGTGVGGGTMLGLSALLTGVGEYGRIVEGAADGDRDRVDLKVKHIYAGAEAPISGDLTASNFGRVYRAGRETAGTNDLLASVLGLVGETVATTSVIAAGQFQTDNIVYIGSSFVANDALKKVVADYTAYKGAFPLFVADGEFSGALGALLSLEEAKVRNTVSS